MAATASSSGRQGATAITTPVVLSNEIVLTVQDLCKNYSVPVLKSISLQLFSGQITGLLGANGAGKSTLSYIIAGLVHSDSGRMLLEGRAYTPRSKRQAEALGVQLVRQELNLLPTLTVAENLFLNRLPQRLGIIQREELHRRARLALDRVGLQDVAVHTPVGALGTGQRQLLEIAAALSRPCRLLILDEPTAALTAAETELLFAQLRDLRRQGTAVVWISHRLEEVRSLADRVLILRDGVVAADAAPELTIDEMVRHMTGGDPQGSSPTACQPLTVAAQQPSQPAGEPSTPPVVTALPAAADAAVPVTPQIALQVRQLTRRPFVHNVSLQVHSGECLGLAGLVGAGRTELLRTIFGAEPADGGHLLLGADPRPRRFQQPAEAAAAGLALVTEDRRTDGLLLTQSIRMNTSLGILRQLVRRPRVPCFPDVIETPVERDRVQQMLEMLQVQRRSDEQPAGQLSGGNQQKVVLGRWLLRAPSVLLLDEPTRGIDAAARQQIYLALRQLLRTGRAIVMVSSDLDELLQLSDRIAVMSAGRLVAEFPSEPRYREAILQASFAGHCPAPSAGGEVAPAATAAV